MLLLQMTNSWENVATVNKAEERSDYYVDFVFCVIANAIMQ